VIKYFLVFFICTSEILYPQDANHSYIQILGIAQDGGYPHMGCSKKCCVMAWKNDSVKTFVVSFALVDSSSKKWWLFEATPDIKYQLQYFKNLTNSLYPFLPEAVIITHAHIGHYAGLMQFGKEVMNTKNLPVYVLPKMKIFLESNGPWSQLVNLKNIEIHVLKEDTFISLSPKIEIEAFRVPHRDEYSETAGFEIKTVDKKFLFIPDIDKWEKWNKSIVNEVRSVDFALLDATFYDANELLGRPMSEVPHPLVSETIELFKNENKSTKAKIYFIHLNHTNPLLWDINAQSELKKLGFNLAKQGQIL
jgi:pyrroloquinoline quinone biosynthesis protein B